MSFGSSKPIAVRLIGTDYDEVRKHAEKIAGELKHIPFLRDVGFEQTLDYPTVEVEIDRELAGLIGVTPEHVKRALVMATASTRFTNLNYWINVKTGFDYLVQIQVPPLRMDEPEDIEELPLESVNPDVPLMVRDVLKDGRVHTSVRPGEYDRDMSQRFLTVIANVEGEDMGRAAKQVRQAVKDAGEAPRGVHVEEMGQLPSMTQMFEALGIGLAVAVFVILVLLTAYFQSPRLALISIGAVPGVLAGIVIILYFSNTTLNIESFMGSIMCLGVSVSNSVMMVTFMDEHWKAGKSAAEAALLGASERLRPILMTACAMTVGMVPMALALERGSQMEAPLGRAVIGGLVMSTFATLLVLPSIFALVIGRKKSRSPSLYPANPESTHYDPQLYGDANGSDHEEGRREEGGKMRRARNRGPRAVSHGAHTGQQNGPRLTPSFPKGRVSGATLSARPGSTRSAPPAGVLASGRARWRRAARRKEGCPERLGASGPQCDPSPASEDRPRRRTTELCPELRAHVDLSEDDRIHREVERGYRRQGAEGRRARRPLRARAARGLGDQEGNRRVRQGGSQAGPGGCGGRRRRGQGGQGAPR